MVFRDYPIITRYSISTTNLAPRENHSAHNYIFWIILKILLYTYTK